VAKFGPASKVIRAVKNGNIFPIVILDRDLVVVVPLFDPLHENQVDDLFDGGERVGDAAGPKTIPQLLNISS
jgi:hypothetical protein